MKQFTKFGLLLPLFALLFSTTACEKNPIEGTATQELAGEWSGVLVEIDYGIDLLTYNTAANNPNEIWLDDQSSLIGLTGKVKLVGSGLSYTGDGSEYENLNEDGAGDYSHFKIGKFEIVKGGAKSPAGHVVDALNFELTLKATDGSYESYTVECYRKTGFDADL